ncbi:hypothetical protein [Massilia sp. S19_KUP03_FR1]|uniref:hypothetical protein n=1 Tax=Massilia sp. S19_KUP03_FR1 TaxID=3025503 RepID=UPI002FCCCFDE
MKVGASAYRAVVDWVELEVQLLRQSNFWTVKKAVHAALRLPQGAHSFFEALDAGSGSAASAFRFRIQDLNQMRQLSVVIEELNYKFGLSSVRPIAVELAFDTFMQGGTVRQLAEVATDRFKFNTAKPGDDWHFYRMKGEGRHYANTLQQRRDLIELFEASWQLTDRNSKDADIRYHAYVKTQDNKKSLIPSRYCARLEVTLRGMALPFTTIPELIEFNFTSLAHHFKFRRLADDLHPAVRDVLAKWSGRQLGRNGRYRRPDTQRIGRYSGTSRFRGSTVADEGLNTVAYECLRKLTREWRSNRSRADFPETFCA